VEPLLTRPGAGEIRADHADRRALGEGEQQALGADIVTPASDRRIDPLYLAISRHLPRPLAGPLCANFVAKVVAKKLYNRNTPNQAGAS